MVGVSLAVFEAVVAFMLFCGDSGDVPITCCSFAARDSFMAVFVDIRLTTNGRQTTNVNQRTPTHERQPTNAPATTKTIVQAQVVDTNLI